MEGVVLYVALVRVFIEHPKRYMIAFTVASYGMFININNITIDTIRCTWFVHDDCSTYWICYW